jgi:surface antigen
MKKIISALMIIMGCTSLISCSNMNNQDVGVITGGIAGGLLGSTIGGGGGHVLAIAAGTVAGAFIGSQIGRSMDQSDRARMNQALENNPNGQPAYWRNVNTGATYSVLPTQNVKVHGNKYCREYRTTANVAGKTQQIYGTACRQPDGTWKIVK